MPRYFAQAALAALLLAASVAPGLAHPAIAPEEASVGETIDAVLTVVHCDDSPTIEVRLLVPEGFEVLEVPAKDGWQGDLIGGATPEVRWSGGVVPEDGFEEFMVRGTVGGAEGHMIFPLTQICANGRSVVWSEIAAPGEETHSLEHPAPVLQVLAAGAATADDVAVTLGDLTLSEAFTRATLPGAPVGGGYLTIANAGTEADRLIGVSSPAAAVVQLHEMKMEGDVMKMAELPGGIEIPAGETVRLAPGGMHLMFMGLKQGFAEGDTVAVTLTFEKAGTVEVPLQVRAVGAATH